MKKKNKKTDNKVISSSVSDLKGNSIFLNHVLYLTALCFVFIIIQKQVFKKDIDINGDNASYYIGAKSIDQGDGYANILSPSKPKANKFPPGYPLLMSIVMKLSKSFVAQKIFNSILLLFSCILLYFIVHEISNNKLLALASSILPSVNYLILHFNAMMMSETSFIFFSTLSFFSLYKLKNTYGFNQILREPYFYLLVFSSTYAYHIRTQGIALIAGFVVFFLLKKEWKISLSYLSGFIILALPWIIRNRIYDIGSSRYLHQMLAVNNWRPEEGLMTFGDMIKRMFSTSEMLITKAIPNSIIPNNHVNYSVETTLFMWIVGISIVSLIIYGIWDYCKNYKWIYLLYIVFSCGIITLWNAPSGNRYLVTIVPFLQIGFLFGVISLIQYLLLRMQLTINANVVLIAVLIISLFSFSKDIDKLSKENKREFPPAYKNYFSIAKSIKNNFPDGDVVISSRKPSLFFLYSNCYNVGFSSSLNDTIVIKGLVKNNVDFVVLEQLGYSSTPRYLVPAINKNKELFSVISYLKNPDTYLLGFDIEKAKEKLNL